MAEDPNSLFIPEVKNDGHAHPPRRGPFEEVDDDEMDPEPEIINNGPFCVCRGPERQGDWMIQCDASGCGAWFHGKCVNLSEKQDVWLKSYLCPRHSMRKLGRATFKMAEEMEKDVADGVEEEEGLDDGPAQLGIKEQLLASTGGIARFPGTYETQIGFTKKSTSRNMSKKAGKEHNPMFVDSESDVSNYSPDNMAESESEADFEIMPEPFMAIRMQPRQARERSDVASETPVELGEGDLASFDLCGLKARYMEDGELEYERCRVYSEEEIEQTEAYKIVRQAIENAIMSEV